MQPEDGSCIPGIRRWPKEYLPSILSPSWSIRFNVSQHEAETTMRALATQEGIFAACPFSGAVAGRCDCWQVQNANDSRHYLRPWRSPSVFRRVCTEVLGRAIRTEQAFLYNAALAKALHPHIARTL